MTEERRMVKRTDYAAKGFSVADTLDWCIQRDLDPLDVRYSGGGHLYYESPETDEERDKRLEWTERQEKSRTEWEIREYARLKEKYGIGDEYHTMDELYEYRMLYNAAFANVLSHLSFSVSASKSYRHSDGELCFGGGWFVVYLDLPTGQISNHYENQYWDLFRVPEVASAPEWDGHTPAEAAERLRQYCLGT